ncbi:MAG: type VI secretion system baseplate subunit TssG [Solidesulfovibrio sp. DCME]|uniref:type VI secretion system baseplate subunit TssG n=1 Tax=Solidesulfovibrio sp. DCME TaxID=3447380 RepID=UPI003D11FE64
MADPTRGTTPSLKDDLLAHPGRYSFFQAVLLLRHYFYKENVPPEDFAFIYDALRVRPHLSLAFPGTDLTEIVEDTSGPHPVYRMTATFLGLYGSSSPLPTFYTEDLLEEQNEDVSVTRDFLDVVNSPFYPLIIRSVVKYRLFYQLEVGHLATLERLYCLLGYGHPELRRRIPKVSRLLRYIGLFTQWPRSAMGLRTLVADALGGVPSRVEPNIPRQVAIPDDQRLILGEQCATLGEDAHLGSRIKDRTGKIRLVLGPLDETTFHGCLPGQSNFRWLLELIALYPSEPVDCRLEIVLCRDEARPARLGSAKWGALGLDTWVFSGTPPQTCRAVFELKPHEPYHDSRRS